MVSPRRVIPVCICWLICACSLPAWARGARGGGGDRAGGLFRDVARQAERANRGGGSGGSNGGNHNGGGDHGGRGGGRYFPYYYSPFWGPSFGGWYGSGRDWYRSPYYDPFYEGSRTADGVRGTENILVDVSPPGTIIRVNGAEYGKNGRARFSLPEGKWRLELTAPGYVPQHIELDVQPGIRYDIRRTLERDRRADPSGKPLKSEDH